MAISGKSREKGFALIAVLLFLVLLSAMAVTLAYTVRTEKRIGGSDQEGNIAYYDAEAGMEKMTADLGTLYTKTKSPTAQMIRDLGNDKPGLPDVGYKYVFNVEANPDGSPESHVQTISAGDFAGLSAQIIPINLDVTATRITGAQAHLTRDVEVAQIPVFQFGVFSDSDLSYFAGPNFDFGGRVHTNGDLYLGSETAGVYYSPGGTGASWIQIGAIVSRASATVVSNREAKNVRFSSTVRSGYRENLPGM